MNEICENPENPRHPRAEANLANCLAVNQNLVYYSEPGIESFRKYFKDNVAQGAVPVNVWDFYHCYAGEIHCATATIRELPSAKPWWEEDAIKTNSVWMNEH